MREQVRRIIACPNCHSPLVEEGERLICKTCQKTYDVYRGVPILFPDEAEISWQDAEEHYSQRPWWRRFLRRILLQPRLSIGETMHDRLKREVIFQSPPDAVVLNLGSGTEHLYDDPRLINFDIFPHRNAEVVGDAHFLPFLDGSFDVVWMSAVLEHIRKPWIVSKEVERVLKPGGKVLVSVPFIQKGHGAPHDYFRYTPDGLRSLFDGFEEIECGPTHTRPTGTLVHVIGAWANAVFPGKIGLGVERLLLLALFWLKFIDWFVPVDSPNVWVLSGGSCYLGRKRA